VDDLEFRKTAIIDPDNQDPEFLQKKQQSQYNRRFVIEQQAFKQQLANTINISTPENLADRIILKQQLGQHKQQSQQQSQKQYKQRRHWLMAGIAAVFIITFTSRLLLSPTIIESSQLAQQVITHIHDDTHALNVRMDIPKSSIDTMLASYGGKLSGPVGNVSFLGHCIVGGHTGIHLVLDTSYGLVTVLILPKQSINEAAVLADNSLKGILYPTQKGSIAIVAEHKQAIETTREKINQNLNWII